MAKDIYITLHGIGTPTVSGEDLDCDMWIQSERFESLLRILPKGVIVTFDDGFDSCWYLAVPILHKCSIKASFFVTVGKLDCKGYLNQKQVKEMSLSGLSIGTHGMHHRPWRKLDDDTLREEIFEAKDRLEELLEKPVTEAACPFGAYDRRTLRALKQSGIERVYTSDRAVPSPDSWIIPRYTIRRSDTLEYLEEIVARQHDATLIGKTKMILKRYR